LGLSVIIYGGPNSGPVTLVWAAQVPLPATPTGGLQVNVALPV